MNFLDGLSTEELDEFFSNVDGNILNRREGVRIEFKKTFDWSDKKTRSKYLRTIGSFANTIGGLIIFGISDSPRTIVGITNFDSVDDAEISNEINNNFNQQIRFIRDAYHLNGKKIGIIRVFEAAYKPIICTKDSFSMKENDIYFRYNSRSTKIAAGDLRQIIDDRIKKEREKWVTLLNNISKVGIDKVGFMNLDDGEINFAGNRVIIDEELLSELKIIDEYSIRKDGAPALKLKGEIDTKAQIIKQPMVLQSEDIYKAFLNLSSVIDPLQYIKVISQGQSKYYPIWFLLRKLGNSKKEIKEELENIKSTSWGYENILERVELDTIETSTKKYSLNDNAPRAPLRKDVYQRFLNNEDIDYSNEEEARTLLEAFSNLDILTVEFNQVQLALSKIYNECYPFEKGQYNYLFQRILALVDYLYFSEI
ncbi:AlbA family DNA-binding domain-containing protein [Virgibacillus kimchii]